MPFLPATSALPFWGHQCPPRGQDIPSLPLPPAGPSKPQGATLREPHPCHLLFCRLTFSFLPRCSGHLLNRPQTLKGPVSPRYRDIKLTCSCWQRTHGPSFCPVKAQALDHRMIAEAPGKTLMLAWLPQTTCVYRRSAGGLASQDSCRPGAGVGFLWVSSEQSHGKGLGPVQQKL